MLLCTQHRAVSQCMQLPSWFWLVYRTSAFPVKHHMIHVPMETTHVCVHYSLQVRASCVQLDIIASVIYAVCFYRRQAHSSQDAKPCMAEGKFFQFGGAITFTTHHKQLCAVDYVLHPSHRNVNILRGGGGGASASQAPTCLWPCLATVQQQVSSMLIGFP